MLKMDEDDANGFGHRNCYQMSLKIAKVLCVEIATTCSGRSTRTSRQLMHRQISPEDNFTLINLEVEAKNMRVAGCCSCSFYMHTPICCTVFSPAEVVAFSLVSDILLDCGVDCVCLHLHCVCISSRSSAVINPQNYPPFF